MFLFLLCLEFINKCSIIIDIRIIPLKDILIKDKQDTTTEKLHIVETVAFLFH